MSHPFIPTIKEAKQGKASSATTYHDEALKTDNKLMLGNQPAIPKLKAKKSGEMLTAQVDYKISQYAKKEETKEEQSSNWTVAKKLQLHPFLR